MDGEESGGYGEGSRGNGGGKWGLGTPLSTPSTTEPPQTSLVAAELQLIGVTLDQVWWQLNYRTTTNKFDGS